MAEINDDINYRSANELDGFVSNYGVLNSGDARTMNTISSYL